MTGPERPRDWRGSLRLLRGPFRTLVLGQSLGQFGDGVAQVAFAQLVVFDIGKGATPGRIAVVFAVTLLPFCVVGPLAGVFIDRWDRRRTLITASAARSVLVLAAIAAAVWRLEPLAYLGVVLLLSSSRFVLDAKGAVLPRLVGGPDLVRANAMSGLLGAGSSFVGAVSAAMFVSWSVVLGFLIAGGSYLLASACFGSLPAVGGLGLTAVRLGEALRQLGGDLRNGAATIVRLRQLRRPLAAVSAHRLLLGAGFVLLVLIADHRYHLSTTGYGLAIAVTGVATVIGAVSAPWLTARWRPEALLALGFLPPAAAIAVCGYAPTLAGLLAALGVTAVSFQILKVVTDALVGGGAPDAVRGRVFSIYDVLYNLAFVLAGLAMIPLWRPGHERSLLWWLAAAFGLGWLVMARVVGNWPYLSGASATVVVAARWRCACWHCCAAACWSSSFPSPRCPGQPGWCWCPGCC